MKKNFIILFFLFIILWCKGQDCGPDFASDTLYLPAQEKILEGSSIQATLKDNSVVKLFKTGQKYYLKLFVTSNFYFNKIDLLEIRSGSKSFYVKESKQYKANRTTGMFVFEVFRNYVSTLRDEGITSIVFAKAETRFTKKDASQVKRIARSFYECISGKN
jgi:hypothetical protein